MEQRKFPRMKTKIAAEVNNSQAVLENVSKQGLKMILWSHAVPENRDISVMFAVGEKKINLKGEIRWCMRDKYSIQDLKVVGLYIENAPEEYHQFVDSLSARKDSQAVRN